MYIQWLYKFQSTLLILNQPLLKSNVSMYLNSVKWGPFILEYTFESTPIKPCTFAFAIHSIYIFLNSNKPSCSQMNLCTLNIFKLPLYPYSYIYIYIIILSQLKSMLSVLNIHSSIRNIQCNTYNLQTCICTLAMLQFSKPQTPIEAPNVHRCPSNTKHPKGSSKHYNHLRSTP